MTTSTTPETGRNRPERRRYDEFVSSLPEDRQAVHMVALVTWLGEVMARRQKEKATPVIGNSDKQINEVTND